MGGNACESRDGGGGQGFGEYGSEWVVGIKDNSTQKRQLNNCQ